MSAIAIELFDCNLGADDDGATHALVYDAEGGSLCDHRTQEKVYVAPYEEVMSFLDWQHPPRQKITKEQWEEIKAQLEARSAFGIASIKPMNPITPEVITDATRRIAKKTNNVSALD